MFSNYTPTFCCLYVLPYSLSVTVCTVKLLFVKLGEKHLNIILCTIRYAHWYIEYQFVDQTNSYMFDMDSSTRTKYTLDTVAQVYSVNNWLVYTWPCTFVLHVNRENEYIIMTQTQQDRVYSGDNEDMISSCFSETNNTFVYNCANC